jgi:glycosyltransferase involved in cell wall biosynthesis
MTGTGTRRRSLATASMLQEGRMEPLAGNLLPLTALVSSRNEADLLGGCLRSIDFCDELVVIDIESTDGTASVAEQHGARVVQHPFVPIAEWARVTVAPQARHDWLLVVDPDEEVPPALATEVAAVLPTLADDVAAVDAPRQYYFAGRRLQGTVWGGPNKRRLLVHRGRVELTATIWGGMRIHPGKRVLELPFTEETAIVHRWAGGYRELVERHRRYLKLEPVDRAAAGEITGWRAVLAMPWRSFHESYVAKHGYRDGATGLGLSVFYAVFRTAGELALVRRLRQGAPS